MYLFLYVLGRNYWHNTHCLRVDTYIIPLYCIGHSSRYNMWHVVTGLHTSHVVSGLTSNTTVELFVETTFDGYAMFLRSFLRRNTSFGYYLSETNISWVCTSSVLHKVKKTFGMFHVEAHRADKYKQIRGLCQIRILDVDGFFSFCLIQVDECCSWSQLDELWVFLPVYSHFCST